MTHRPPTALGRLLAAGTDASAASDADLLDRFARGRDEASFELLVWRHAGMVLRACRAVLRDHHAAEDACQAAFLALAHQAHAVGRRGTVAGWLYRVARRIATRAARRRNDPTTAPGGGLDRTPAPRFDSGPDPDAVRLLHEELDRLPEKYRAPILLCFLDGLSHADAARRLGVPVGTVAGRVARAKERPCRRLTGRGVAVPAAGLMVLVAQSPVGAVAPAFVATTVRAAVAVASGGSPEVSSGVLELAREAGRTMTLTKLHGVAGVLVACALVAGVAWAAGPAGDPAVPPARPPGVAASDRPASGDPALRGGAKGDAKTFELPKGDSKAPDPLPPEVIAAWTKAGGTFGWMEVGNLPGRFAEKHDGRAVGERFVPAFRFDRVKVGVLGKLPRPQQAFGLQLRSVDVTDETLQELADLGTLQALSLDGSHVTDAGLKELAGLKQLRMLNLGGTDTSDAGLKQLAGLTALRALGLRYDGRITDVGLKELAGLKALRVLDLSGTSITDAGLKHLAGLEALEELTLDSSPVSGAGFKELAGLKTLRELQLASAGVTDAGLKGVAALKSLRGLSLTATPVTDAGLKELTSLKGLETLDLSRTELTGTGLSELAALKSLRSLNLSRTKVTDAALKGVGGLTALDDLDLSHTQVTDVGLKELAGLKALGSLALDETGVTDAGVEHLAGLKTLNSLALGGTRVTGTGLENLTGSEQLLLGGAPVTDTGLKSLTGMKGLWAVDLANTKVTDEGLKELAGLTALRQLYLGETGITDKGLKSLAGLKSLVELSLTNTKVTDKGLDELVGLTALKTLDVEETQVTDKGLAELRKKLPGLAADR